MLWGGVGAAAILLIAAFLPSASVSSPFFEATISGTGEGNDGWLTLVLAIIAGGLAAAAAVLATKQQVMALVAGIGVTVAGVLAGAVALIDIFDIMGSDTELADLSVGIGLWITLLASIALVGVGAAVLALRK